MRDRSRVERLDVIIVRGRRITFSFDADTSSSGETTLTVRAIFLIEASVMMSVWISQRRGQTFVWIGRTLSAQICPGTPPCRARDDRGGNRAFHSLLLTGKGKDGGPYTSPDARARAQETIDSSWWTWGAGIAPSRSMRWKVDDYSFFGTFNNNSQFSSFTVSSVILSEMN